jgi:hypothetical protein
VQGYWKPAEINLISDQLNNSFNDLNNEQNESNKEQSGWHTGRKTVYAGNGVFND